MRKKLSLTLILVLVLSMCLKPSVAVKAIETNLTPLPNIGDVISGFKTIEVGNMDMINSKTVLFEHEKTGAKLLYIQNKDIDRSFDISFKTPAADNTGVNHVIEHMSVSGSQKYPLKDLAFTIMNQTYCTYLNAYTRQNYTTYPVSSMSENQLLKLMEVYLDCVYNPSLSNSKNLFLREAWRYEMADADAALNITGTVYNEMKGDLGNISSAASQNVLQALFPNSTQSMNAAGIPDSIKNLKYDQVMNIRNTYYHPSNSFMVLYGNVNYKTFLKLINDDYLSKYDRKDIKVDLGKIAPASEKVEKVVKFPVAASSNVKNSSQIDYAYAMTDLSEEDTVGLGILADVLNQETSPLMQVFNKRQIGGRLSVSFNDALTQPVLTFSVQNADESRKVEFKNLIDTCTASIAKTGLDKEVVDAVVSNTLLSKSNFTEKSNVGVNLSMEITSKWANFGDTHYYSNLIQNIKSIKAKAKDGYLEKIIAKYIVNNSHAAFVITVPEAGLEEKQANDEKKYLTDLKERMGKKEVEKIVADTKAYDEWNRMEPDQKIAESLQAIKIDDLPEEVKKYEIDKSLTADGVQVLSAAANVGDTESTELLFDTSAVPIQKLHYLQLYVDLFGKLDTKTYTQEQLNTRISRYLSEANSSIRIINQKNSKQYTPYLSFSWMGIADEYDEQMRIVKDILLNTKFDNSKYILSKVKTLRSNIKTQFTSDPLSILILRGTARFDESTNFQNYISGLDYYNFLIQIEKKLSTNPKAVVKELKGIKKLILNKTNMVTIFAGNSNNIKKYKDKIKIVTDALPKNTISRQDYSKLPKPALREGIAIDSTVQYNIASADYQKLGTNFNGKLLPMQALIEQNYITPKIRFGYGAYAGFVSFSQYGFLIVSYRDPNIKQTFEVYKGLPNYIKNINITQKSLDRFILNAYSSYTAPIGELTGAKNALHHFLAGEKAEDELKVLREIKSTTVQDVKDSFSIFNNFIKNGSYSTAGNTQKLNENKELYDDIISIQ